MRRSPDACAPPTSRSEPAPARMLPLHLERAFPCAPPCGSPTTQRAETKLLEAECLAGSALSSRATDRAESTPLANRLSPVALWRQGRAAERPRPAVESG